MTLLDIAMDLAGNAGRTILAVRARGFDTHRKSDQSPVTEADHAAEAVIVAGLRAGTPYPVVAEEEIAGGHVPDHGAAYWLVDPLDGTREFAAGRDEFAVCIGLVRGDRPVLGVVGGPAEVVEAVAVAHGRPAGAVGDGGEEGRGGGGGCAGGGRGRRAGEL